MFEQPKQQNQLIQPFKATLTLAFHFNVLISQLNLNIRYEKSQVQISQIIIKLTCYKLNYKKHVNVQNSGLIINFYKIIKQKQQQKEIVKMQKQSTSLKRSAINGFNHQGIIELEAEQLISQIQQIIHLTSQKMKQKLQTFQYNQLVNFKQDLFKTQDQFIKVRQQRNQEQIRKKVLNHKNKIESKFQVGMKKSLEMNAKYDELKIMLKKMNQDQNQLKLQISFMNKKLATIKKQGVALDKQFQQLKDQSAPSKQLSRFQKETNIFKQLVNNCENERNKKVIKVDANTTQKQQFRTTKLQIVQKLQKSTQLRLRSRVNNLKDYIQNIPLQLNFIQQKLKSSMIYPHKSSQQKENHSQQKLPLIQNKIKKSYKPKAKQSYLEEILKNDQVKEYLYDLLFCQ